MLKKYIKSLFLILLLMIPSLLSAQPLKIVSLRIENGTKTPTKSSPQISEAEIRNVILLQEGDPFDSVKLDQAISYLKKWGRFPSVTVEKKETKEGVHLTFFLKEGLLINNIFIRGSYPFLTNRIQRILTIHPGELFNPDLMEEQIKKIRNFYERNGYWETQITFIPSINDKKGTVNLLFKIQKGHLYRLHTITVHGNTIFPTGYFVSKLNPLLAYQPGRFRQKIEEIRKDYRSQGYLNARVRIKDLGINANEKRVHPMLEIIEGKRVIVRFRGNSQVSPRTFKNILPLFTEGGTSDYDIEASLKVMTHYYHKLGFKNVQITSEKKEPNEKEVLLTFFIKEGLQTRVKKIHLEGNHEISSRTLKKNLLTQENTLFEKGYYEPYTVEQDFRNLPDILKSKGATQALALEHETHFNHFGDKAHVTFTLKEGPILRLHEVRFEGNQHFTSKQLLHLLKLRHHSIYNTDTLNSDKNALTLFYANAGYPYMTIQEKIFQEGDYHILSYTLHEGTEVHIGKTLIVGNERSLKSAIEGALLLKKGDRFNYKKILESERLLRRTGSYRSVSIETIGLAEKNPIVHLLVKVEEYRKIVLDLGATYNTGTAFNGTLSLSHVNLLGTNKRANLTVTGGPFLQSGEIILSDPHFVGVPLIASLGSKLVRQVRPGFTTLEGSGSFSILKEFTPQLNLLGRYQLIRTLFNDITDSAGLAEENHTTSLISFSVGYDKRDSFSDPHSGYVLLGGFDISNKIIASNFDFIQPKGYVANFVRLFGPVLLIHYLRIEGIQVFGNDRLSRERKLFLGGDYSLRGFEEDSVGSIASDGRPTGGQFLVLETTEIQTRIFKDFKLALFSDNGSLTDKFSDMNVDSFRHSAGFGLRYTTPVGPLRLDYGIKLDRRASESFGRLHFAFGYSF